MPSVHSADSILAALAECGRAAFGDFAHAAAPAVVAAVWQDALVALALILCLRFVLRVSAAHRFVAWAAGFAVAALLPFVPFFDHAAATIAAAPTVASARAWLELDSRWGFAIAALWLAASSFRATELALNLRRLHRLWSGAIAVETESRLRSLLAAASPARRVEICTTSDLDRPSVIGFFAPRILIPEWLYPRLTPGELVQVVLHEAEHLRRRDDWTNLLQKLFLVVFPLNPALVWMERRLCREREMACDEGVVQRTQAPRTYAACLTALAERGTERREFLRRAQALSLGAFERRPELFHRVDSILRRKKALPPLAAGALVGLVGCGLLVGAFELSRCPQLVAFVAVSKPDTLTAAIAPPQTPDITRISDHRKMEPGPTADNAVFHPSSRYLAVEARSIVASRRRVASTSVAVRSPRGGATAQLALTERFAATRRMQDNPLASIPEAPSLQGQELIVLTAWEEVETSAPRTREVADYETGADTQMQSKDAVSMPNSSPVAQISVTRLILLVYPASPASDSSASGATGAKPARATGSRSYRPTASAFDSGWLFFQL